MSVSLVTITLPLKVLNKKKFTDENYLLDLFEMDEIIREYVQGKTNNESNVKIVKNEFFKLFKNDTLYIDKFIDLENDLEIKYKMYDIPRMFNRHVSCYYPEHDAFSIIVKNQFDVLSLPIEKYGIRLDIKDRDYWKSSTMEDHYRIGYIDSEQINNINPTTLKEIDLPKIKQDSGDEINKYIQTKWIPFFNWIVSKQHDLFYFYD
jgi:hypothetical protein